MSGSRVREKGISEPTIHPRRARGMSGHRRRECSLQRRTVGRAEMYTASHHLMYAHHVQIERT